MLAWAALVIVGSFALSAAAVKAWILWKAR